MAGSDNDSDNASIHNEAPNNQPQQKIQPQIITTVSNNNAKFPYLKKDDNNLKRTGRDSDGGLIILPLMTVEEHLAIQRESKARTTLLQSIPDDHIADFHYMDDARDIWNAVKARFGGNAESKKMRKSMLKQEFLEFRISEAEGLHKGYDRMQKILSQLNQLKAKLDAEDINLRFLRALPSSWSQVALTLKTKGGLEFLSFDDLYYKLKTLKVDVKGYSTFSSSQSAGPSHSAFVSATSTSKKMPYGDSPNYSSITTYSVPSISKTGSHKSSNVIEDVLQSFVVDTEPEQQLAYEDLEQIEKLDLKEMDLKWKMVMLSVRVHRFEQKARRKIDFDKKDSARFNKTKEEDLKALIIVDTLVDWSNHDNESDEVIVAKEFGMLAGYDSIDAIKEGATKLYNLINGAISEEANTTGDAGEFALMGVTSEKKLDNHLVQTKKWRNSSKNLFKLIDSSMSIITKVGLGFTDCLSENELGWDDSAFSVFTTTSEDVEGRSIFHSDKSSEVNTNDFASSNSNVKSLAHKPSDSISCASNSSVSTFVNEAEIESNVGTPITEPACHFRKNASFVSKLCFVCGSGTHLIKDCDFYEKQMANTTVGLGMGPAVRPLPVPTGKPKVKPVPTGKPTVTLVPTSKPKVTPVSIGKLKVTPVSTGKPKVTPVTTGKPQVSTPLPTGRPNGPFPVPSDRGYSPSDNPFSATKDEGIFNSGCSRSMTEEHIDVQRESKVGTTLLQSIPDDHVADFHYMDDARDIWNAVKARFGENAESKNMRKSMLKQEFSEFRIGEAEGLHKGYNMRQKILSQLNQFKAKPEDEDINLKFLRALPSSLSQMSKDKLLFVQANQQDQAILHLLVPPVLAKRCHIEIVQVILLILPILLHQTLRLDRKLDLEKMDLKWQMAMFSVRVHKFEQKDGRKIDFDKKESARFNKKTVRCYKYHDDESDEVITAKEFGMIAGCASEDAIKEGAAKIYNLITEANLKEANTAGDAGEFALRGVTSEVQAYKNSLKTLKKQKRVFQRNQLTLKDKIRVLSIKLENTSNLLKHSERINADFETAKKDLQIKLDNRLVQTEKWRNSSKNLFRLIDSSMSIKTNVGLGFTNCISENELGWDDSAFSVFTTNSKDVEGRPIFHRFAKTNSMKVVPPPLSGDYTSLSDHIDLDELQMSYGTKSSISCDFKSVSNDFVSCDDSDKSSEVNTNDFASSDSSVKSSEPKPNDSTSCASTFSVSTSVNEAEIESNVGTPIQEPIIVQDLPSFSCNSFDKHKNTSRTSCNKNGYVNKKAGHFRKNASSVSKLCFLCSSGTHLIKDCDFYEKQMANKTVGVGVGSVHSRNKVYHKNQFVSQAVLLRTGKVNIPTARPQPVPTGTPKVFAPVPTGRPNRPFPLPTDRRYSSSVISSWWKRIDGQLLLSPQQENPFSAVEDERIFDSGCSRSMTGNKERLDDFQAFQGGKVMFGGGEGKITGKGTIRTPTLDFKNVYYVKELQQFNLFSISQICDKKNQVLFTYTECLVLSKDFKLPDDSMVVLRVPRKHNLYTINLNNLCHRGNLACLVAHASFDESIKWHRRMGHVNYKNMNRLVKGNLVRVLPPKLFKNDHTCVACCKGKQHKASYKAINAVSSISEPLQLLHMDLFGSTSIRSIDHKYFCLVITDDYSRFCWVFFLEHKHETYPILKDFINLVENQLNKKREYSNPRTLQQNRVAERKNKTLIEAAKTMLADSKLPTMFWTEAVRTACYVLNRVSVTSPHNKTPYALLTGHIHSVSHFKPFGCHVTILNISDHLGKFDGKADEGYIVGYSASNKAYRVYNMPNKRVEESMNLRFLKEKPTVQGTQGSITTSAGTPDTDSDSDYDEQVIIVPSYPSLNIQRSEPKDTSGDEVDDSLFQSADEIFQNELARLKDQEQRVTSDAEILGLGFINNAEELQTQTSVKMVPPGCIPVPTGKVPGPPGSLPVPTGSIPIPAAATKVSTDDVLVYTSSSTDLIFSDEPTTRFSCPSDLGNDDPSPGKYAIVTKWILKNKRDARGIVVRNKARLVAQGHRQEEGIDYDEVFAPVTRIKAIRLFLAFASYMGFLVYQMDVKSAFLYERIDEEGVFQMSAIGELTFFLGLQVQQRPDGIFINQDKYVQEILNKFDLGSVRTSTTPYEAPKHKSKNESDSLVNVHLYRSMIGSLMYLTALRHDIMFAVSACSRNQVTPTTLNLEAVKKIFKYLKGQPKLGLWYPKELPLVLEAYSDSDYAGANKDRKSTTGGCQFLGGRLISWQCKKQTIVATSSTEAEYVTATNCCGQVLWIQNQLLDYGASVPSGVASVSTGSFIPTDCLLPTGYIDFPSG
uniref:Putative ribonuclease H-like domain-containing protein n=1 Tax=Tanacetum cinerariifolium TaxID=118510 RepID=A0A6L2N8X0_TANCI|nr:putative ribonuclease H-like domain-containing protein [Tanacetum cinerariifolium]